MAKGRLVRSKSQRQIAGVAAGTADYFDLDPTLVRILWLCAVLVAGIGLFAYIALWLVLPEGEGQHPTLRAAEQRHARGEITAEELAEIRALLKEKRVS